MSAPCVLKYFGSAVRYGPLTCLYNDCCSSKCMQHSMDSSTIATAQQEYAPKVFQTKVSFS